MIALGMDPSLTGFGWCIHDSSAVGMERIVAKGLFTTSAKDIFVRRYMYMRDEVMALLDKHPEVEAVGSESPAFGEQFSEGLYALFTYVNEAVYTKRKDVVYFDPGTLKMLAKEDHRARKGKMFKADMVEAVRVDTGLKGRLNHNEADAYHVARFAARFFELLRGDITTEDLIPSEYHAFARVHTFQKGARAGQTVKHGAIFKEKQRFFRFSLLDEAGNPKIPP
jgi:Holliday junction resolvasome RuvABC endonuclease subunit